MNTTYPKDKIKVLLLENIHKAGINEFEKAGYTNIESLTKALSEDELLEKIKDVHILGIRSKTSLTPKVIQNAPKLLAVGCFCIGTNQVHMESATNHGLAIFNSPFSNTRSVAELVIGNAIHLMRRIPEKNQAAHLGQWLKDSNNCYEVRGKTLGILGYGHIGSQVSVLAESLGMRVIYFDIEPKLALGNASRCTSLNELIEQSDIVSLHVPGSSQTKNLINRETIKKFKRGAILINLSRGEIIDAEAVKEGIESGKIGGAAVDVFPVEPEATGDKFISPLQNLSNVILTPHIGGSTMEAQENIGVDAASKLVNFVESGSTVGSLSIPVLNLPIQKNAYRLLHIHKNLPGVLGEINSVLSGHHVNILSQYLQTNSEIGYVVLDIDKQTSPEILKDLKSVKNTIRVRSVY